MGVEIKSETIDIAGQTVQLVSVRGGEEAIGTFTLGANGRDGGIGAITRLFYIGGDPIINMTCPNYANKKSDKLMSFCPGYQGYDRKIHEAFSTCFNRLNQGDSLTAGMREIFGMLQDGVYATYVADYYPTDGNGVYFWGGYNISHEVRGTAEHNRTIGDGKLFKPCFLIPTQSLDYYNSRSKNAAYDAVEDRKIQGIAYHISGFHSALLKGHHGSVACVENDIPFRCAVIEKICDPYVDRIVPAAKSEGENAENKPAPPVVEREGITGFRGPSVKIPFEAFPKDMLNLIIGSLSESKPAHFQVISAKLGNMRKKAVTNNVLPYPVLEKAEKMPDVSMVESAYAISSLSDEELNSLLAGDVEYNGKVIISPNFYASIVTACNFLQFTDTKRFVDFSIAIMENPELSATHEYVAQRVSSQENNTKLYNFFNTAAKSGDAKYEKILPAANTFISRYGKR